MKRRILAVLGSPRKKGYSTYLAQNVVERLEKEGAEVETIKLYDLEIQACTACDSCRKPKSDFCIIQDDMKPLFNKILQADSLLLSCPIYWFSVNAKMKLFIDRFYGFNTEKTEALKDKCFSIILSYGDVDPYSSGAVNAIRMFEDAFKYTDSRIGKILYKTEVPVKERELQGNLEEELAEFSKSLLI